MKHEIRESGGHTVVAFEGDVDLDTSPVARKILLDCVKLKRPVVVDMSGVSYIDSSGVASLVESLQTARKAGIGFRIGIGQRGGDAGPATGAPRQGLHDPRLPR